MAPSNSEELVSSDVTRITGESEAYAVDVELDSDGERRLKIKGKVADVIDGAGVQGALTVGTSAVEVRVGTFRLANRRMVTIQPTTGPVWFGWTSAVTTSTGTKLFPWQVARLSITDTPLYLISDTAGRNVRITEAAWVP
jgi:hypothetical protein